MLQRRPERRHAPPVACLRGLLEICCRLRQAGGTDRARGAADAVRNTPHFGDRYHLYGLGGCLQIVGVRAPEVVEQVAFQRRVALREFGKRSEVGRERLGWLGRPGRLGQLDRAQPAVEHLFQRRQLDRLGECFIHANRAALVSHFAGHIRRARDDRNPPWAASLEGANRGGELIAVHAGHLAVGEHQAKATAPPQVERFLAVRRGLRGEAEGVQLAREDAAVHRMVVHHEDQAPFGACGVDTRRVAPPQHLRHRFNRYRCFRPALGLFGVAQPQREAEAGADPGRAFDVDARTHQLGQALADRQAQAGTPVAPLDRLVGLTERLEQALQRLCLDADAGVAHRDANHVVQTMLLDQLGAQLDLAMFGELDRIAEQVVHDLAQPQPVQHQCRRDARVDVAAQLHAFLTRHTGEVVLRTVKQFDERRGFGLQFQLVGLDLGEIEHVVDQPQQRLARLAHRVHGLDLLGVERAQAQQFEQADHCIHRRADLVAHDRQESALGTAAGFGGVARFEQVALGVFAFRDVGVDRHHAAVGQRHAAHLENDTVAAHPLEAVRLRVARQCHARSDVGLRIARPVAAAFGDVANHGLDRYALAEQLGRHVEQMHARLVADHQFEVLVDQRHPDRQRVEQGLQERRLFTVRGFAPAQRRFGALSLGDVGVRRDPVAIGHLRAADLDDSAVGHRAFDDEGTRVARAREPCGDKLVCVARPVHTVFGMVAKQLNDRATRPQQLRRRTLQTAARRVGNDNIEFCVDKCNADRQRFEKRLQISCMLELRLGLGQRALGSPKRQLGLDALGHVAGDATVTREIAVLGEHRLAADVEVAHAGRRRAAQQQVAKRPVCLELGAVQLPGRVDRLGVRKLPARLAQMGVAIDAAEILVLRVEVDKAQLRVLVPEPVRRQRAQRKVTLAVRVDLAHFDDALCQLIARCVQRIGSFKPLAFLAPQDAVGMPDDQEQHAIQDQQDRDDAEDDPALADLDLLQHWRDVAVDLEHGFDRPGCTRANRQVGGQHAAVHQLLLEGTEMVALRQLGHDVARTRREEAAVRALVFADLARFAGVDGPAVGRVGLDLDDLRAIHGGAKHLMQLAGLGMDLELRGRQRRRQRQKRAQRFGIGVCQDASGLGIACLAEPDHVICGELSLKNAQTDRRRDDRQQARNGKVTQ